MAISLAIFVILILIVFALMQLGFLKLALYGSLLLLVIISYYFLAILIEAYKVVFIGNAPYVRSKKRLIARILKEINFKEGAKVYDLGCGDGKFIRTLVQKVAIKAVGYEYFFMPYLLARLFNFFQKDKVKFIYKDFFKANLEDADYIFCYLMPKEMERLEKKLLKELRPGTIVISNTFQFKTWAPENIIILDDKKKSGLSNKIYIYRK